MYRQVGPPIRTGNRQNQLRQRPTNTPSAPESWSARRPWQNLTTVNLRRVAGPFTMSSEHRALSRARAIQRENARRRRDIRVSAFEHSLVFHLRACWSCR